MNVFPIGNKLIDINILSYLNDEDLRSVFLSDKYLNELHHEDYIWRLKLDRDNPPVLPLIKHFSSYQELYKKMNIQAYVAVLASPRVYNSIHDAYNHSMRSGEQIPPIDQKQAIIEFIDGRYVGDVYALPYGQELLDGLGNMLLHGSGEECFVSPILADMPVLEPNTFIIYGSPNTHICIIIPFNNETMMRAWQSFNKFSIQRSDSQKVLHFKNNKHFCRCLDPDLIIIADALDDFILAEGRGGDMYHMRLKEMRRTFKWKPLASIQEYL